MKGKSEYYKKTIAHSAAGCGIYGRQPLGMDSVRWIYHSRCGVNLYICAPIQYKDLSYQYRKSHCGDKTVVIPCYLHNGISYIHKTTSLYWIGALAPVTVIRRLESSHLRINPAPTLLTPPPPPPPPPHTHPHTHTPTHTHTPPTSCRISSPLHFRIKEYQTKISVHLFFRTITVSKKMSKQTNRDGNITTRTRFSNFDPSWLRCKHWAALWRYEVIKCKGHPR